MYLALTQHGSGNGLTPSRRRGITWTIDAYVRHRAPVTTAVGNFVLVTYLCSGIGIKAWTNNYIHIKQRYLITHTWPNFIQPAVEWIITSHITKYVITYPCPNLGQSISVKPPTSLLEIVVEQNLQISYDDLKENDMVPAQISQHDRQGQCKWLQMKWRRHTKTMLSTNHLLQ